MQGDEIGSGMGPEVIGNVYYPDIFMGTIFDRAWDAFGTISGTLSVRFPEIAKRDGTNMILSGRVDTKMYPTPQLLWNANED